MTDDAPTDQHPALLTKQEHLFIERVGELTDVFAEICGKDASAEKDWDEFVFHVHALQRMVGAQAAARAYPQRFRLLGDVISDGGCPDGG